MKFRYLFIFSLLLVEMTGFTQHNVNSPYTMYGIGYMEPGGFGRNKAMGGAGIALQSEYSLNNLNPASYSSIDSLHFYLETGINTLFSKFSYRAQDQNKTNFNFSYLALGFRINKWWANSLGLAPFSDVGYSINTVKPVEGSNGYSSITLDGSGGLNQFYWGNSFKINKNFSVGINSSYLFGSISQSQKTSNDYMSGTLEVADETTLHNLYFDYGAQYRFKLPYNISGVLGAVYGTKTRLNVGHDIAILDTNGDTLSNELARKTNFYVPQYFGFGVSLNLNRKLLITGDYMQSQWAGINQSASGVKLVNSSNVAVGIEYLPSDKLSSSFFQSIKYRIGAYNEKSYLKINGSQLWDYGITAGMGIPLKTSKIYMNIAFSAGFKGNMHSNSIINETYYKLHLNFTLFEYWFARSKYN